MAEAVMAVMAVQASSSKAHDELHHKEPVHCAKRASAVRTKQTGSRGAFEQARAVHKEKDRQCHKLSVRAPVQSIEVSQFGSTRAGACLGPHNIATMRRPLRL